MFIREQRAGFSSQAVEQLISLRPPRERNIESANASQRRIEAFFSDRSRRVRSPRGNFSFNFVCLDCPERRHAREIERHCESHSKWNEACVVSTQSLRIATKFRDQFSRGDGRLCDGLVMEDRGLFTQFLSGRRWFDDEPLCCPTMSLDCRFVHWSKHRRTILFAQKTIDIFRRVTLPSCCKSI